MRTVIVCVRLAGTRQQPWPADMSCSSLRSSVPSNEPLQLRRFGFRVPLNRLSLRMARCATSVVTGNANRRTALAGIAGERLRHTAAPPLKGVRGHQCADRRPKQLAIAAAVLDWPGGVRRYPTSPRTSRIAAPDRTALGMKAKAGLAATNSAKSSSACVEIKIVGTSAPNPLR